MAGGERVDRGTTARDGSGATGAENKCGATEALEVTERVAAVADTLRASDCAGGNNAGRVDRTEKGHGGTERGGEGS